MFSAYYTIKTSLLVKNAEVDLSMAKPQCRLPLQISMKNGVLTGTDETEK
jgi:hypothetical protein